LKVTTLLCTGLLAASTLTHAQNLPLKTLTGSEIGVQLSTYKYEEDDAGSFIMSLEGRKLGITGAFVQSLKDDWFWGMDGRYVTGNVDYKSASTGEKSANPDDYYEFRLTAGRDLVVGTQVLAPYAGLGYRYLKNDLRGNSSTGHIGYRRSSTYLYLPIGIHHRVQAGAGARFVTTLEYDYLIEGRQKSYMTDAVGGFFTYTSDLTNLQRSGHGLRLGLAYETRNWSLSVFHHMWDIARSDDGVFTSILFVHTAYEPHNITRETGLLLRYHFR